MKWTKTTGEDGGIEYTCSHGIGHGSYNHTCDGCCGREDYPLKKR